MPKQEPKIEAGPQDVYGHDTFTPEGEVIKQTPPKTSARDPELQAIIDAELAAFDANKSATILRNRVSAKNFDIKTLIHNAVELYVVLGGSKANLRRGLQIVVDQWLMEELLGTDLPGPDKWIVPKIREMVVLMVGKQFDKLTG